MRHLSITLLLALFLFAALSPSSASAAYSWEKDKRPRPWMLSVAPGYGMLFVGDEGSVRHGFDGRIIGAYHIDKHWSVEMRLKLGIFEGGKGDEKGIYSLLGITPAFRYSFLVKEWFTPYVALSVGYLRTELDREQSRIFKTHSMTIEPAGGLLFKITGAFWLGLETAVTPIFLGDERINGSFGYRAQITADLRF